MQHCPQKINYWKWSCLDGYGNMVPICWQVLIFYLQWEVFCFIHLKDFTMWGISCIMLLVLYCTTSLCPLAGATNSYMTTSQCSQAEALQASNGILLQGNLSAHWPSWKALIHISHMTDMKWLISAGSTTITAAAAETWQLVPLYLVF
jgi:hypothetical protein